jgi:hypothetical protein
MPTQPTVDATGYRQVQFQGGRILQAREVLQVQSFAGDQPSKGSYAIGGFYQSGATLNINPVISQGAGSATVTLQPKTNGQPMLVFVNNRFEQIPSGSSLTFTQKTDGTTASFFVNWVLWRVTANGDRGSLTDPTLVDANTGETVAELGQLQIYVGADDSGPVPAATGTIYTMFARNTAPLPMFTFTWASGKLTWTAATSATAGALASLQTAGLVFSTTGNPLVVGTDDTRMSNTRIPTDLSIKTQHVSTLTPGAAPNAVTWTNENGAVASASFASVVTNPTVAQGISTDRLYYPTWQISLSDAIACCWGRIQSIFSSLQGLGSRISSLENAVTPNYNWHFGKNLGRHGTNLDTHPPVVDCTDPNTVYPGFTVVGNKPAGNPFLVLRGDGQTANGYIYIDGNYVLSNPDYAGALNFRGTRLDNLLGIGAFLRDFAQFPLLRGDSIITGITPVGVSKGVWNVMNIGNNGFGFNSGWQIAFGAGFGLNNGETVQLPPGWTESIISFSMNRITAQVGAINYQNIFWNDKTVYCDATDTSGNHLNPTANWIGVAWRYGF